MVNASEDPQRPGICVCGQRMNMHDAGYCVPDDPASDPADMTSDTVIWQMAEVIKKHVLRSPRDGRDFHCECGWTSRYPVSEHPRHVAEQIEGDELLQLMRSGRHG